MGSKNFFKWLLPWEKPFEECNCNVNPSGHVHVNVNVNGVVFPIRDDLVMLGGNSAWFEDLKKACRYKEVVL